MEKLIKKKTVVTTKGWINKVQKRMIKEEVEKEEEKEGKVRIR